MTRTPRRLSIAAFNRRATPSVTSFSSVPCGPRAPCSSPPWPASMTMVRSRAGRRDLEQRRRLGCGAALRAAGRAGGALGGLRRRSRRRCAPRRARRLRPTDLNDAKRGPSSIAMLSGGSADVHRLDHVGDRRGGQRGVERVGIEAHQDACPVLDDRVRRCRQDVEGHPGDRAERLDARRDARHAQVADDDQPRRPAQLEPRAERRRERARHEVDRHEPAAALLDRRRRQRDHAARRQRRAPARRSARSSASWSRWSGRRRARPRARSDRTAAPDRRARTSPGR